METSQIGWIDTHCHLYADDFAQDSDAVILRALEAGVHTLMLPNIDSDSIAAMDNLVHRYPHLCKPMMGLHPCSVKEDYQATLDQMRKEFDHKNYYGVGETGIDLYWDTTFKQEQIDAFQQQIRWAAELDLPVIIHSRESLDLNIEIIEQHQDGRLRGIFHCFSGTIEHCKKIEKLGFKMGIGGVVTFKKAGLAEMLPHIPLELIVLETDAPYLAPVPYRGKRNEPSYLLLVAQRISEALGMSMEELARVTSENAEGVFRKKA